MYYKVMMNKRTIDLLDKLIYVEYQKKNDVFLLCDEEHAQGVMSSDMNTIRHVDTYPSIDKNGVDTVSLIEINKYEYEQLKPLGMKTPEEIIDAYTLSLLNGSIL